MPGGEQPLAERGPDRWRGAADESSAVRIDCRDGVRLHGHLWPGMGAEQHGSVIINAATGVLARYYHPYARFLAANGFEVLTYDYRGIGQSRPASLRGSGYRWRDWGEQDFDAALSWMLERRAAAAGPDAPTVEVAAQPAAGTQPGRAAGDRVSDARPAGRGVAGRGVAGRGVPGGGAVGGGAAGPMLVVGHSIGGFLPGLSARAGGIDRILTMGAQYAYWRDYAPQQRRKLFLKWHVAMPLMTAAFGYFPGRRLGWLEDLPAGVAHEWSFRRARMERNHPPASRQSVLDRFAAVTAPILAIAMADDELGTLPAIRRTLAYYRNAPVTQVLLSPADFGVDSIGHFGLFHDRHAENFWRQTLVWLKDGVNPWAAMRA